MKALNKLSHPRPMPANFGSCGYPVHKGWSIPIYPAFFGYHGCEQFPQSPNIWSFLLLIQHPHKLAVSNMENPAKIHRKSSSTPSFDVVFRSFFPEPNSPPWPTSFWWFSSRCRKMEAPSLAAARQGGELRHLGHLSFEMENDTVDGRNPAPPGMVEAWK